MVTTNSYDAANRLAARSRSDGHTYTYDWSQRGQLLTEWTQGYPVRAFSYDGAGRMIEARVFTQTTEFVYNGLGDRVAVNVDGYGATTYVLDYAAGQRILAETTPTETVSYLYGRDCLGEFRDDEPLYYLHDAEGYVRQGTDITGDVVSAWLFDPDGTVLEGPAGPVSHLVCGGVYDWSTGLIYRGGRYFDPNLGIWLALMPLMVVQSWTGGRKKGRGRRLWTVILCVAVAGTLTGCPLDRPQTPMPTPTPDLGCIPPLTPTSPATAITWTGSEPGYFGYDEFGNPRIPISTPWPQPRVTPRPENSDGVNVRSGPTAASSVGGSNIIGKLYGDAEPIGQFGREAAGTWWWKIRYNDHGQVVEGWVRSDVVVAEGNISFPPPKPWVSPFDPGVGLNVTWEFIWGPGSQVHNGVDIQSSRKPGGDRVVAMADGAALVFPDVNAQYAKGTYWINVLHEHPDGKIYWIQYTHIAQKDRNPALKLGTFFTQQTWLGSYSDVGDATGPHLHISIKETCKDEPVGDVLNPANYIPGL